MKILKLYILVLHVHCRLLASTARSDSDFLTTFAHPLSVIRYVSKKNSKFKFSSVIPHISRT